MSEMGMGHTPSEDIYVNSDQLVNLRHFAKNGRFSGNLATSGFFEGSHRSRFRGRGMDFAEVRPYQPGDDIRTIDWRVTARTQRPHTKLFHEEKERPTYVLIDQRSPMFFGSQGVLKSVRSAQVGAIIGWLTLAQGDNIGALIFGDNSQKDLKAKSGHKAMLNLIHGVCEYNQKLTTPLASTPIIPLSDMLQELTSIAKPGSQVFIISDFHDFDKTALEPLSMLSRHTSVSAVRVFDPIEKHLPNKIGLSVFDGQSTQTLSNSKARSRQFASSFDEFSAQLKADLDALNIGFGEVDTCVQVDSIVEKLAQPNNTINVSQ